MSVPQSHTLWVLFLLLMVSSVEPGEDEGVIEENASWMEYPRAALSWFGWLQDADFGIINSTYITEVQTISAAWIESFEEMIPVGYYLKATQRVLLKFAQSLSLSDYASIVMIAGLFFYTFVAWKKANKLDNHLAELKQKLDQAMEKERLNKEEIRKLKEQHAEELERHRKELEDKQQEITNQNTTYQQQLNNNDQHHTQYSWNLYNQYQQDLQKTNTTHDKLLNELQHDFFLQNSTNIKQIEAIEAEKAKLKDDMKEADEQHEQKVKSLVAAQQKQSNMFESYCKDRHWHHRVLKMVEYKQDRDLAERRTDRLREELKECQRMLSDCKVEIEKMDEHHYYLANIHEERCHDSSIRAAQAWRMVETMKKMTKECDNHAESIPTMDLDNKTNHAESIPTMDLDNNTNHAESIPTMDLDNNTNHAESIPTVDLDNNTNQSENIADVDMAMKINTPDENHQKINTPTPAENHQVTADVFRDMNMDHPAEENMWKMDTCDTQPQCHVDLFYDII